MKKSSSIVLIALTAIGLSSCMKEENYPDYPVLSSPSFVVNSDGSATLQVNFTDGNGDIGYQDETNAPVDFYIEILKDSVGYYVPLYVAGQVSSVMGDTLYVPYNIPYLTPTGKDKELSGQIQVQLGATAGTWYLVADHSYYEYRIWMLDRAGNVSNRITTIPVQCP